MPTTSSFSVTDLERASAAIATAALARPCPVLLFCPVCVSQIGAGPAGRASTPPCSFVAIEPPRRAADADAEELWQLARHRLVREIGRWRMRSRSIDGRMPTQAALSRAADALVAAAERRLRPGDWVGLSADDLSEITRAQLLDPGREQAPTLWVPLVGMPERWPWALAEARRRILAAHRDAGRPTAFGFPAPAAVARSLARAA